MDRRVLALDTDYVAVTDQGVFRGLAERDRLMHALLTSLVKALSASASAILPG